MRLRYNDLMRIFRSRNFQEIPRNKVLYLQARIKWIFTVNVCSGNLKGNLKNENIEKKMKTLESYVDNTPEYSLSRKSDVDNGLDSNNCLSFRTTPLSTFDNIPIPIQFFFILQGLADAFLAMRFPFVSEPAKELNKQIFETIYYGALEASCELAEKEGPYSTYAGSPVSKGILQYDMVIIIIAVVANRGNLNWPKKGSLYLFWSANFFVGKENPFDYLAPLRFFLTTPLIQSTNHINGGAPQARESLK